MNTRRIAIACGAVGGLVGLAAFAPTLFPEATIEIALRFERDLAGLERRTVVVQDHTIHYLDGGPRDAPVVLALHGFGVDKDSWTRMARAFTGEYRVIAPDLPGWGESTALESASYDIESQARRVDGFARALHLPPHHLAGNSMGGQVAAAYTVLFPERVRTLALVANAGVRSPKPSELSVLRARGENPLLVASAADYERLLDFVFVERPWIPSAMQGHFAARATAHAQLSIKIWEQITARPYPLEPVLAQIQAPVLILWGENDRVLDVSCIEAMKPLLPEATIVVMKACGHGPMVERPSEFAEHYLRFLTSPH